MGEPIGKRPLPSGFAHLGIRIDIRHDGMYYLAPVENIGIFCAAESIGLIHLNYCRFLFHRNPLSINKRGDKRAQILTTQGKKLTSSAPIFRIAESTTPDSA